MAVTDHRWSPYGLVMRCTDCAVFTEQADAECWRPVETNRDRLSKALAKVLSDFTVADDGTVYYKGMTDGSNING